jgi:aminoglycoside phosphotransferase (APT) family kinase protein
MKPIGSDMSTRDLTPFLTGAGLSTGLNFERASGGQRNETWVGQAYVIRLNADLTAPRLVREAKLLSHLPASIPKPKPIAWGQTDAVEWLVQQRVSGQSLAHVWPTLTISERKAAVAQLGDILSTFHQTNLPAPLKQPSSFDRWAMVQPKNIIQLAERVKLLPFVDHSLIDQVIAMAQATSPDRWHAGPTGMIHGDLHFDNLLWEAGQISALLDYETAHIAPLDLELDLFLRYCAFPTLFVAEKYEDLIDAKDYQAVPGWLYEVYPALFEMDHLVEHLRLYSLAYDLKLLMDFPPRKPVDPTEETALLNRIQAVVARRSYLDDPQFLPS